MMCTVTRSQLRLKCKSNNIHIKQPCGAWSRYILVECLGVMNDRSLIVACVFSM